MEPSGHAFGVPKDKLREIRGRPIRAAMSRIALRAIRATLALLVAPVPLLHPRPLVLPVQEHGNGETSGCHRLR
jgi:hypothetical protein